jgi:hypothetical protein
MKGYAQLKKHTPVILWFGWDPGKIYSEFCKDPQLLLWITLLKSLDQPVVNLRSNA